MFDFTKEVVINSKNFETYSEGARGDKFRVHGGGDYFGKYIVDGAVYKTAPKAGRLAVLEIDATGLAALATEGHISLNIELSLDRDARADWGSYVWYFKKPMAVDLFVEGWTADNAAEHLSKALGHVLTDYKFAHVLTADDAKFAEELGLEQELENGKVYVVGGDFNVCVRRVKVVDYRCDARCANTTEEAFDVVNADAKHMEAPFVYTPNAVEFGTYNYLLHNLRMPTYENWRFTSQAAVEMPMAGAEYVQFTFMYCVPRPGFGGLSVAGQYNHSMTTHVFFVKADLADQFAAELEKIEVTIKDINTDGSGADHEDHDIEILPDSFATSAAVTE
jgi:hypothetical protein